VLQLRVYGPSTALSELGRELEERAVARHLALTQALLAGHALLTGEVSPGSADTVLRYLAAHGVAERDVTLTRSDDIGSAAVESAGVTLVWADVIGQATANARPVARFLAFMTAAGVIAGFGVIDVSVILIVGAMAVSPDALPIAATCVGLVGHRGRLVARALSTLVLGLAAAALAACALSFVLQLVGELPPGFQVGETALSGLTTVNVTTVGVALAAGVAGMLALETRASAGVGVAISVTTIPAAAYLGVAGGLGQVDKVPGTVAVLAVNVVMIIAGGAATLLVQRRLSARSARPRKGMTPPFTRSG
jgi:uncharacterized hydrophobic protein (TIGR00271 family)